MKQITIDAVQEIAAATKPICGSGECGFGKFGCCHPDFCWAVRRGVSKLGYEIEFNEEDTLPYMGPFGCRVPAELRPACSNYVCHTAKSPVIKAEIDRTWAVIDEDPEASVLVAEFNNVKVQGYCVPIRRLPVAKGLRQQESFPVF